MLREVNKLAQGPLADSFTESDRNPPVFDPETHSVTIPEAFKKSYKALTDGGWDKLGIDEELGGLPTPRTLYWAIAELILGATPAPFMYAAGAGRSDEHTSEPQSLMRISYAVFCLKNKKPQRK